MPHVNFSRFCRWQAVPSGFALICFITMIMVAYTNDIISQNKLDANGRRAFKKSYEATEVSFKEAGTFRVVPSPKKTLGAEVFGIAGLKHASTLSSQLQELINQHKVLVFRKLAARLTPEDHISFAKLFGTVSVECSKPPDYLRSGVQLSALTQDGDDHSSNLAENVLKVNDESPYTPAIFRVVRNPNDQFAFGEGWHTDLTYRIDPPKYATLAARVLPPKGGDTFFVDMNEIYNNLNESVKESISEATALHSNRAGYDTYHPIVRVHPYTGKKTLFVNVHFTQWQQDPLLEFLSFLPPAAAEANAPYFFRHVWQDDDLIMWDEMATQHSADGKSYIGHYRECHRVLISGEKPIANTRQHMEL